MKRNNIIGRTLYVVGMIIYIIGLTLSMNKFGVEAWLYTICACAGVMLFSLSSQLRR